MDHIETAILNCYGIREAEQNMVFAARLTQHGHTIQNMADLMELYHQSYSQKTVENIAGLPHPTVQKFMVITVAVVGASRRFLAQITRHQNEVKYMSASLQYSNYSGHAAFAIPYEIMKADKEIQNMPQCFSCCLLIYSVDCKLIKLHRHRPPSYSDNNSDPENSSICLRSAVIFQL